jgi:hypothetical protein
LLLPPSPGVLLSFISKSNIQSACMIKAITGNYINQTV